ncbi:DUF3515 domain-containing protein [Sinomonas halotolerans]|uniref:DUF3515 domain-containing protein n=1 Tax=Sinomonas halotolerans TaxID=1644133 RepID=A0ABU9X1T3_9MICC
MRARTPALRACGLAALTLLAAVLSGCAAPVAVEPAPGAADPACAPLMIALPQTLGDASMRKTTSQATAAWGDPSVVVLRCGVASPGPTTDRCVSVNGVDWVIEEGDPYYTLTTFGREPATEILLDEERISSATVLASLSGAVEKVPAARKCVGKEDLASLPAGG